MYNLLLTGEYVSPGIIYNISVGYKAANKYPLNKGMIIPDIELTANFLLKMIGKDCILNKINIQLCQFEIEDIINLEENGEQITRVILKGNEDSKVIYLYKPTTSESTDVLPNA
jgi:hypothetical protein